MFGKISFFCEKKVYGPEVEVRFTRNEASVLQDENCCACLCVLGVYRNRFRGRVLRNF